MKDKNGEFIDSPLLNKITFTGSFADGLRGTFVHHGSDPCETCTSHWRYKQWDREAFQAHLRNLELSANRLEIEFKHSDQPKMAFVINNRMGMLRDSIGGYNVDETRRNLEISFTSIEMEIPNRFEHKVGPNTAFPRLGAYRKLAQKAYTGTLGEELDVRGYLGHGSPHNSKDADFENQKSKEPSPFIIHSHRFGSTGTHRYYSYRFEIVDVCEGRVYPWEADNLSHPAGEVPRGFRAITCKCKCCPVDPKYVVAYAGTSPIWDIADWGSNIGQGIPIYWGEESSFNPVRLDDPEVRTSRHYVFALEYMRWVYSRFRRQMGQDDPMVVCGHSLGGGMASFVAGYFDIEGYCYNAAPLSSAAQVLRLRNKRPDIYCTHVQTHLDPVSGALGYLPFQNTEGQVFTVDRDKGRYVIFPIFQDHYITTIGDRITGYYPPRELGSSGER